MWKVTVPPWTHLCFSSVSSYEILIRRKHCFPLKNWSSLLQTVSAVTGVVNRLSFFFLFFLSGRATNPSPVWRLEIWLTYHLFVQERTQGSGELLDMFWLEMTLTRDTKRWGKKVEKSRSESRGIGDNLIPQRLDVFNLLELHTGYSVSACCLFKATTFPDMLIPDGLSPVVVFKGYHSLKSLFVLLFEAWTEASVGPPHDSRLKSHHLNPSHKLSCTTIHGLQRMKSTKIDVPLIFLSCEGIICCSFTSSPEPCFWLGEQVYGGELDFGLLTLVRRLWLLMTSPKQKIAAPLYRIFWLLSCTMGGSGAVLSIFIHAIACDHGNHRYNGDGEQHKFSDVDLLPYIELHLTVDYG